MPRQRPDDLFSWRAARALAVAIHRATAGTPFRAEPELRAELRAAATAVMTAIAEGYEQQTCGEFERRLVAALGATARLESLICLAEDVSLLTRDAARRVRTRTTEAAGLIDALRQAIRRYQQLQCLPAPARLN
jgi:four helix bundle protein